MGIGMSEKPVNEEVLEAKPPKPSFYSVQLGIWKIFFLSERRSFSFNILPSGSASVLAFKHRWLIIRMLKDLFSIAPLQLIIYILNDLIQDLQDGAILYFNSQIFDEVRQSVFDLTIHPFESVIMIQISKKFAGGTTDTFCIARSLSMRIMLSFALSWFKKYR